MTRMMPPRTLGLICVLSFGLLPMLASAQEMEAFTLDIASAPDGPLPPESLFVVDGVWEVVDKDGIRALRVSPEPITDASAQTGPSAKGAASVTARVFASRQARSYPRFGISVHGISGYRLMVNPPLKQIELVKSDEVVAKAPFAWTSDRWMSLRLEASRAGEDGPWSITASAWEGDTAPAEPLLKHTDESNMKGTGKCGLWTTPYSGQPVFFAEVRGAVQTGE